MISPTGIWSHEFWESEGLTGQCSPSMLRLSVVTVLSVCTLYIDLTSSIMNCHTGAMFWTILSTNLHRRCSQLSTEQQYYKRIVLPIFDFDFTIILTSCNILRH
jgi:hypothetical protein